METILVVDDDPGVLALAQDVLEINGYTVLSTGDPRHALRIAKEHPGRIALLLTDVVMPLMNGPELAERFVVIRPDTKVLFMSGFDVSGILTPGAPFIGKPFDVSALPRRVRDLLDRRSPFARPPHPKP
ncbi:MAG TPA: response regulator [Methylomirabilota bacterium]|nr:response regulator [Methylomirabilota bacterium]